MTCYIWACRWGFVFSRVFFFLIKFPMCSFVVVFLLSSRCFYQQVHCTPKVSSLLHLQSQFIQVLKKKDTSWCVTQCSNRLTTDDFLTYVRLCQYAICNMQYMYCTYRSRQHKRKSETANTKKSPHNAPRHCLKPHPHKTPTSTKTQTQTQTQHH